jgi:hypothetical protein
MKSAQSPVKAKLSAAYTVHRIKNTLMLLTALPPELLAMAVLVAILLVVG